MCFAQGPQRSDTGEARTCGPRSQVKHSTTEPLPSHLWKYDLRYDPTLVDLTSNFFVLCANVYVIIHSGWSLYISMNIDEGKG